MTGERLVLKPDAFVRLGVGDLEENNFLEVDRSTESPTVLKRKALTYVAYWQSGEEQVRRGVFPRVLWLVPDERRKQQLLNVLSRLDPDSLAAVPGRGLRHGVDGAQRTSAARSCRQCMRTIKN